MNRKPYLAIAALLAALGLSTVAPVYADDAKPVPAETVSPEVGAPLKAAQELFQQKKYKEALDKINEINAPNKTPYEVYVIERTRAAIATASGDEKLQLDTYQAVIATGRLTPDEQSKFVEAISQINFRKQDYAQAAVWGERYLKEGGTDPDAHRLLERAYYLNNDFVHAGQVLQADIEAAQKAGTAPTDEQIRLLYSVAVKQKDQAGQVRALETFVTYYPKKEYWADLLSRVQAQPNFSQRLELDWLRLKFAAGVMSRPGEYMVFAELATLGGYHAEAEKVLQAGFSAGILGTGADAEKQKALLASETKKAAADEKSMAQTEADVRSAKDGTGMINLGYVFVTTDQFDKGIAMMEQGLKAPGLKRAEEAKLHLAMAYAAAGRKDDAIQAFKAIQANDGSADLARYWILLLSHPIQ